MKGVARKGALMAGKSRMTGYETYDDLLQAPKSAGEFIEKIRIAMRHWLATLNAGMPTNPKVRLRDKGKRRIAVTPLDKQLRRCSSSEVATRFRKSPPVSYTHLRAH